MPIVTQETLLIHEPSGDYPLKLADLRERLENTIVPNRIDAEALVEFGYFPVFESEMPIDGVPVEGKPEKTNDVYYRVWTVRAQTEAEVAEILTAAKDAKLQEVLTFQQEQSMVGVPCLIGEDIYHAQVRSDQDLAVITSLRTSAKEAISESKDTTFEFRMYENVNIELSTEAMLELADHVLGQVQAGRKVIWGLKDAIAASTSVEELPALPVTLFTSNEQPI